MAGQVVGKEIWRARSIVIRAAMYGVCCPDTHMKDQNLIDHRCSAIACYEIAELGKPADLKLGEVCL